jgi:hypothetical protein
MSPPPYSVDTSGLIDGLERFYRPTSFPGLWVRIDELIANGRFLVSEEVLAEAAEKATTVKDWCTERKDALILPTDSSVIAQARVILAAYPNLVKAMKNQNRADAFVIAVAELQGATVVTGEGRDGSANRPKIPYICRERGIDCITLADLIESEGWVFR